MVGSNFKIGLYIRVSTQEQADNPEGSIKNQKDRLIQMVSIKNDQNNFGEIVDIFIDEARSGKDTNRPELKRMLAQIEQGKINLVMVSELSRISRNIQDFSKIWNLMKEKKCSFFSLRENFDTTTASGEMVLYMLANLAQFERRQVSERVSANFLARSKRGLFNGGTVPPGYKTIPEKPGYLEIDPDDSLVVEKCFEYFLIEETLAKAAKRLNRENYKFKPKIHGGRMKRRDFGVDNLYRILTNPALCGMKSFQENGETILVKAVWKGIISQKSFKEVQKKLKENCSRKKPHSKKRYPYIFTGLVYCSDCEDRLSGKSAHGNGGKIGYYEHSWRYRKNFCKTTKMHNCTSPNRFPAKRVHELVLERIFELIQDKKNAERLLLKAKNMNIKNPLKQEIKRFESKRINLDRKLEVLTERLTELPKEVSAKPLYAKMEVLQKQKDEVESELLKRKSELKASSENAVSDQDWYEFLKVFSEIFKTQLNCDEQSRLIKKLVHRIELGEKNLKIHYYVGEDRIKKGLAELSAGPLFLCPNFGSSSLTNGRGYRTRTHNSRSEVWRVIQLRQSPAITKNDSKKYSRLFNTRGL